MDNHESKAPPHLSIVIPAYNEERRLPTTLASILAYMAAQPYTAELLVVDDGSLDQTVRVAEAAVASHPAARVIRNDHRGKGYAVRTGMLAAQGDYILFSDADLATPIHEWEKLYAALQGGYDIAIGSREGLGDQQRVGEPWYRHIMGRVFNYVVRLIAVGGYQDTQCGFKAFRRAAAHDLFRRVQLYGDAAKPVKGSAVTGFDVEVLFLAMKRGYRTKEVPVIWHYGANTKVNPVRDSIRLFRDVWAVRLNDWRGKYAE